MTKQGKEKERLKSSLSLRLWVIQNQEEKCLFGPYEKKKQCFISSVKERRGTNRRLRFL
jgi:hypothetical protein